MKAMTTYVFDVYFGNNRSMENIGKLLAESTGRNTIIINMTLTKYMYLTALSDEMSEI